MSTTTLIHPAVHHGRHALSTGLVTILLIAALTLVVISTLILSSSTPRDPFQADQILVVQNLIVPVPTAPTTDIRPTLSGTPLPPTAAKPSVVPVPVPTPLKGVANGIPESYNDV